MGELTPPYIMMKDLFNSLLKRKLISDKTEFDIFVKVKLSENRGEIKVKQHFGFKSVKDQDKLIFNCYSTIDGTPRDISYNEILTIDGMDIIRFAESMDINPEGKYIKNYAMKKSRES